MLHQDASGGKRLVILEDAGEFLMPDTRNETGRGLSRLLNVSDGLIGQGLDLVFLVTTNEPIKTMHPAVARPGQGAHQVEFECLTAHEAKEWLLRAGLPAKADHPMTLADLHAVARDEPIRTSSGRVGFSSGYPRSARDAGQGTGG